MIWPSPQTATVTILAGALDLPLRPLNAADAQLPPFAAPETAPPDKPTIIRRGDLRIERIDRLGLELGSRGKSHVHIEDNDPLSAVVELHRTQTISRDACQIRVETVTRLSCTLDTFWLQGDLRAFEGANEVCHRTWDRSVPRDFL
jgi:uncharacterized protein